MSAPCPCKAASDDSLRTRRKTKARPRLSARQLLGMAGSIGPAIVLTILPKCPFCLAAYVATATGIGLSLPIAAFVRIMLLIVCLASLLYFATSYARRFIARVAARRTTAEHA